MQLHRTCNYLIHTITKHMQLHFSHQHWPSDILNIHTPTLILFLPWYTVLQLNNIFSSCSIIMKKKCQANCNCCLLKNNVQFIYVSQQFGKKEHSFLYIYIYISKIISVLSDIYLQQVFPLKTCDCTITAIILLYTEHLPSSKMSCCPLTSRYIFFSIMCRIHTTTTTKLPNTSIKSIQQRRKRKQTSEPQRMVNIGAWFLYSQLSST